MALEIAPAPIEEIPGLLPELARLRIEVFREWPYLYEGDAAYEERYLSAYAESREAVLVTAMDGERLVGAATGTPLADHDPEFAAPVIAAGYQASDVFYCAESVLLRPYRGQGAGHAFFDHREAHARAGGFAYSAFCAVVRPDDHPSKPPDYRPLDRFWSSRGYAPLEGAIVSYDWRDLGDAAETTKPMQVWIRRL